VRWMTAFDTQPHNIDVFISAISRWFSVTHA
jgi:hypothetical protein